MPKVFDLFVFKKKEIFFKLMIETPNLMEKKLYISYKEFSRSWLGLLKIEIEQAQYH